MKRFGNIITALVKHLPYLYLVALIGVASPFFAHADPLTQTASHYVPPVDASEDASVDVPGDVSGDVSEDVNRNALPLLFYSTLEGEVLFSVSQRPMITIKPFSSRSSHHANIPRFMGFEYGPSLVGASDAFAAKPVSLQQNFGSNGDTLYRSKQGKLVLRKRGSGGITFYCAEFPKGVPVLQSRYRPDRDDFSSSKSIVQHDMATDNAAVLASAPQKTVTDWAVRYPYAGLRDH